MRHFDRDFALTNRLRTEGTDHLLSAGQAVGVRRFVAQGDGAARRVRAHRRAGEERGGPARPRARARDARDAGRDPSPRGRRSSVRDWTEGIVLRYGAFYGPGTSLAPGEEQFELVRRRKFPLVGDGGGVWSFIHVADAAEATVAAVEHGSRGVYNVVDDDPAPVAEWLPALAQELGAKKPMRVPRFVGRLFAGEAGVVMMTEIRGASNAKAKRELGVAPGAPELAAGVRGGMTDRERLLDELRPVAFAIAYRMLGSVSEAEDVVQEALLRVHQSARGRRADRIAARVRRHRDHPAGDQRAALRARPPRALRRRVAARADHHRRPRRSGPARRDGRLAVAGDAGAAGEPLARAASRAAASRRVRLRVSGDRGDRRQERGQRAPARHPRQTPRRAAPAPLPDDAASSATSWRDGSSRPPSRAISPGSRRCSLTTWS